MEVMREYNAEGLSAQEKTVNGQADAIADWQEKLQNTLEEHTAMPKGGRATQAKFVDKARASAYDHARALDHSFLWHFEVPQEFENFGKKSVIMRADGQRKYELVEFSSERPVLALYCDQGSKFWSCCWFLQSHSNARIVFLPDPAHRAWNDYKLAVDKMGGARSS